MSWGPLPALQPAVACRDPFEAAWERVLECVLAPATVCVRRAGEEGEGGEMEGKAWKKKAKRQWGEGFIIKHTANGGEGF